MYNSGLAPLIMYGELQCNMGPYCTVHTACLHMFYNISCMFR